MGKRGQISYFILVAVALLIVFVGVLYWVTSQQKIEVVTQGSPITAMPAIQNFMQACVELVATKGVYHIAYQGGYVNPKGSLKYGEPGDRRRNHYYTRDTVLPYAVNGGQVLLRSLGGMEMALSHYVLVNLDQCLDFSNFEEQGLQVQKPLLNFKETGFDNVRVPYAAETISAMSTIVEDRVTLDVTYPVLVKSNRGQALITRAVAVLPFRLGRLHSITGALVTEASQYNPYDLYQHCKKYGARDGMINLYLDENIQYQDHMLSVVDARPLEAGFTPLRFQVGILNNNMTGACTG